MVMGRGGSGLSRLRMVGILGLLPWIIFRSCYYSCRFFFTVGALLVTRNRVLDLLSELLSRYGDWGDSGGVWAV